MKKAKINDFDVIQIEKSNNGLLDIHIKEPANRLIRDILSSYEREEIVLQPEFQRQFVWNKKKQKELIKSLYAGFPLPMFYFAESEDSKIEVVDGQQRLTTILGFLKPQSVQKNIRTKLISNFRYTHNGNLISQEEIRNKIKNRNIYCVLLQDSTMQLKYKIFQILNQGATVLKAQEIRNCLFASEMPSFNKLLNLVANKLRKISGMTLDRMWKN
ncbi:MAG: DUF262 domain-containing protein [Ignavibacteriaceae bacterium]